MAAYPLRLTPARRRAEFFLSLFLSLSPNSFGLPPALPPEKEKHRACILFLSCKAFSLRQPRTPLKTGPTLPLCENKMWVHRDCSPKEGETCDGGEEANSRRIASAKQTTTNRLNVYVPTCHWDKKYIDDLIEKRKEEIICDAQEARRWRDSRKE
eukprot:g47293.t1